MPDLVHVCLAAVDMENMVGHESALCAQNGKVNWRYYNNLKMGISITY
jgi:hypothetical protein